jgi:DNA-binding GntR family transcriptional regulator
VVTVVNQGSYVREVSEAEAIEIYRVRAAITGFACAELAAHATRAQVTTLRDLIRQMNTAQREDAAPAYYALNRRFHTALLDFAGNVRAAKISEQLGNELNLFRRRALVPVENMQESNAEHEAIVRAVSAKDADAARAAGECHILGGMRRFVATRPQQETSPERDARPSRTATRRVGRKNDDDDEADGPARGRGAGRRRG